MQVVSFSAENRSEAGSSKSKAIRKEGGIPAVLYGNKVTENFTVTQKDVKHLIYTPDFKIAEIDLAGTKHKCVIRDVQFHPVTDTIVHIDFLKLTDGMPVKVEIPVKTKGTSPGVKGGGSLVQVMRKIKVKTLPESLVDTLYVSISELELGFSVRVRDIEPVDGIEIMSPAASPVALVEVPRALRSAQSAVEIAAEEAEEAASADEGESPAE